MSLIDSKNNVVVYRKNSNTKHVYNEWNRRSACGLKGILPEDWVYCQPEKFFEDPLACSACALALKRAVAENSK